MEKPTKKNSKNGKRRSGIKQVKDNELDEEIRYAYQRLWWLKKRKKHVTGSDAVVYEEKTPAQKKRDTEAHMFHYWFRTKRNKERHYEILRDRMLKASKLFVKFHNDLIYLSKKFGTDKDIKEVDKLTGAIDVMEEAPNVK